MIRKIIRLFKCILSALHIRKAKAEERSELMEERRMAGPFTRIFGIFRYKIKDPRAATIGFVLLAIALKVLMKF